MTLCALASREVHEDRLGTAPTHDQHIFVEVPLPWSELLAESRRFPKGVLDAWERAWSRGASVRVLGIAPDPAYSVDGFTRVISFRRPQPPFARYLKDEFVVPTKQTGALVAALLDSPAALHRFAAYRRETEGMRDLFICTHGTHDVCCGSLGAPLFEAARQSGIPRLRVWRTSHMGEHRFAPTLIDFPEGRVWGALDHDTLDQILRRRGPVSSLRPHYQGWGGLNSPFEQALEGEAFMRAGWEWTAYRLRGTILDINAHETLADVRLDVEAADGRPLASYEGTVRVRGTVCVQPCLNGGPVTSTRQYAVDRLDQVAGEPLPRPLP